MGNFEALGDAVTGRVVGRAVEPKAGEGADGHTHETHCLNCDALLAGPFCHECGQHAHVHHTLAAFFHDFLHGVLHFEGKIWRTLPLLAWKPGELTRRYIDGQRASFVPPVHMYGQLRGTYGVGRWGAIWRTSALTVFAFIAIGLFASLLVGIGAWD